MLQELVSQTGAGAWAIASMLFFAAVYLVITLRVLRTRREELDGRARLVFDRDERQE